MVATKGSASGPEHRSVPEDTHAPASTRVDDKPLTPAEEVAARSADADEKSSDKFVKVYTVLRSVDVTDETHHANRLDVVRQMINLGMRVPNETSEVSFDGEEDAPDGESKYLTYSVTALPAGRLPEDAPLNRLQVVPGEQPKDPRV
jgi:hypothetical protein